jgi:hypothetical protein
VLPPKSAEPRPPRKDIGPDEKPSFAQAEAFARVEAAAELRHVTTLRVNRVFTHPSDRDPRSGGDASVPQVNVLDEVPPYRPPRPSRER